MYAIFEDGSRQFMVEEGDRVQVDFREVEIGSRVEFDNVLLFHTGAEAKLGQPAVAGAKVIAEAIDYPSKKSTIQKFRRRKNYRRFKGHRQYFLDVRIVELVLAGWERPADQKPPQDATGNQGGADEAEEDETEGGDA